MKTMGAVLSAFVMLVAAMAAASAQTTAGSGTVIVVPVTAQTASFASEITVYNPNAGSITLDVAFYEANNSPGGGGGKACADVVVPANRSLQFTLAGQCTLNPAVSHFGLLVLTDLAGVNPFYGYARVQNPQGIGFSVEGFPADNFNDQVSHATGLKKTTGGLIYQTNCFVGSLAEPATYTLKLFDDTTGAQIGATIGGSLAAFQQVRYLDVFGPGGVNAAPANYANVRAEFAADPPATLVGFCTVQDNASFGADFRIGKSYGGPGTVVSLAQGTGIVLTPNPITSSGTIAVDPTVIQRRVSGTCPAGSSISAIAQSGTVTCEADDVGGVGTVTSLSQGTGIVLTPNPITSSGTIAVDTVTIQSRVSGTCPAGSSISAIAQNGTVTCEADNVGGVGTVTSVATGAGLQGGPITGVGVIDLRLNAKGGLIKGLGAQANELGLIGCAAGQVLKADGTFGWSCASDAAPNAFLLGGNDFGVLPNDTAVLGTTAPAGPTSPNALDIRVGGSRVMRYEPNAESPNLIGGHPNNSVGALHGQTVSGGGTVGTNCYDGPTGDFTRSCGNQTAASYSTIGGGKANRASDLYATVAGGAANTASGDSGTVGGGIRNTASSVYTTVAGGAANTSYCQIWCTRVDQAAALRGV